MRDPHNPAAHERSLRDEFAAAALPAALAQNYGNDWGVAGKGFAPAAAAFAYRIADAMLAERAKTSS